MDAILFTGFPGFLGSELLPKVLARATDCEAVCLVQQKFASQAAVRVVEIVNRHPDLKGRIRLTVGDIVQPSLGLGETTDLESRVVEIFHLAAIYDLSVERDFAYKVNVVGTRNMIGFAGRCRRLRRFQYVSTCYVSGRYEGVFTEEMLEAGQTFNNFYEETKYLAEVDVRGAMRAGLPASIYRPSIVVGDSRTGATQKYDGPYFAIQWLLRQPSVAIMPVVGDPARTELNVVPRDFVVEAINYLSGIEVAKERTFHLADPQPLTVDEMLKTLGKSTKRKIVRVPLPLGLAKFSLDKVPGVYDLMRIPSSAIDYFVHPTRYATDETQALLSAGGIRCPRFNEYADHLIRFVKDHPEVSSKPMA